jgi:phosphate transport system substrate-binding protein
VKKAVALLLLTSIAFAITIRGSGSTFVYPFLSMAAYYYQGAHVVYQGVGSGAGLSDLVHNLVDFAGSDVPMPKEMYCKELIQGRQVIHVPVIAGAVVVTYNVPELGHKTLRLDGKVLAEIYMGKIRYWDDPRIKALQTPDVARLLPHKPIVAVHRSDASGTTNVFTLYLSKSDKEWAKLVGAGLLVSWPVDKLGNGIGAPKNQGVALTVMNTPYSIGYVEYAYAVQAKLPIAALKNADGYFVLPTPKTIEAATRGAMNKWVCVLHAPYMFTDALILAPGKDAYPIVAVPYMIFFRDNPKLPYIVQFVKFIYSDQLQQAAAKMGYAPLSKALRQLVLKQLEEVVAATR